MGLFHGNYGVIFIVKGCNFAATSISCGVDLDEQPCITRDTRINKIMDSETHFVDYHINSCYVLIDALAGYVSIGGNRLNNERMTIYLVIDVVSLTP